MLARFDALDAQTGEIIAIQASKSRTPAQAAIVVNPHLKALTGEDALVLHSVVLWRFCSLLR